MKNYTIMRNINLPDGTRISKLEDAFLLGDLTPNFTLSPKDVKYVLDSLFPIDKITIIEVETLIYPLILKAIGVSTTTNIANIMAGSYLILRSSTFKFEGICEKFALASQIDKTFSFIARENMVAPLSFMDDMEKKLNEKDVLKLLVDRNSFLVKELQEPETTEFYKIIEADINTAGSSRSVDILLGNLGINTSSN